MIFTNTYLANVLNVKLVISLSDYKAINFFFIIVLVFFGMQEEMNILIDPVEIIDTWLAKREDELNRSLNHPVPSNCV